MGIGKSRITPSINVDDMLEKAEISHEIEVEKQDADKRLTEIREAKYALVKIHQDIQDAIKAERDAAMTLKAAVDSSDNVINGICNAIIKAERNTQFKATIKSEHLAQLQELLNQTLMKHQFVSTTKPSWSAIVMTYYTSSTTWPTT